VHLVAKRAVQLKGVALIFTLLILKVTQVQDWRIRWLNAPYRFLVGPLWIHPCTLRFFIPEKHVP